MRESIKLSVIVFALVGSGCVSAGMSNPEILAPGEVRVSGEAHGIALGAPARIGGRVGVGVIGGVDVNAGGAVVPFRQERPYAEGSPLRGRMLTAGIAKGFRIQNASKAVELKVGFDYQYELASYVAREASLFGGGGLFPSWNPGIEETWLDRQTSRYRLLGTAASEGDGGNLVYAGLGGMFVTHDAVEHSYSTASGEPEYLRDEGFEYYASLELLAGYYHPLGTGRFGIQIEGICNIPFVFSEDVREPGKLRFYAPARDLGQIGVGLVMKLGERDRAPRADASSAR
jgi:hypothetical protein